MAVYSTAFYRERMVRWKNDVIKLHSAFSGDGGAGIPAEKIGELRDLKRRLDELEHDACKPPYAWTMDAKEFADSFFGILGSVKCVYDCLDRQAKKYGHA